MSDDDDPFPEIEVDADMRGRAAELYEIRKDLLSLVERGTLAWRDAFEEMYLQGFRKLTRARGAVLK